MGTSLVIGSSHCCICGTEDVEKNRNLHAAGAYHASSKKTDTKHVIAFTKQMYDMALALGKEFLLNKLAVEDVACNELFYHSNCLEELENDYKGFLTLNFLL